MKIDFSKLSKNSFDTVIHPREIFSVLPGKNKKYQYLRDVQAEVIKAWFERRTERDIVLKMNTGSGKTVVGLLILKSCVNEIGGTAVYVSPDSYLVKQVMEEAKGLGIEVTDDQNSTLFLRGRAILVINVHKLINGKSVFGVGSEGVKIPITSILIDDVHASLDIAQQQFTLNFSSSHEVYKRLLSLFHEDLKHQSEAKLLAIDDNDANENMLVPYWAWIDNISKVNDILYQSRDDEQLLFKWALIKDSLRLCRCVIGGNGIEISPRCLPIKILTSFVMAKRRIFTTATLADDSVLVTHFDIDLKTAITEVDPKNWTGC